MIKYTVRCAKDHAFEGWFKDSATFDKQAARGDVVCPVCGSKKISKAPMAPRLSKSSGNGNTGDAEQRMAEAARAIRDQVEKNCDYVGAEFAEEARRIHYGETEERGIYGETTLDDARELDEEGISVYPLPGGRRDG